MPSRNIESEHELRLTMDRVVAAINARDFDAIEHGDAFDPDCQLRTDAAAVEGGAYRGGPSLWRESAKDIDSVFRQHHITVRDVRRLADGRVLAVYGARGVARSSGIPLDQAIPVVWTMRDGKFWRGQSYNDVNEAFESVGLSRVARDR